MHPDAMKTYRSGAAQNRKFSSWLQKQDSKEVNCSFEQIEKIIQAKLSPSAYKYAAWWSNSISHPLMRQVVKIGWESKNLDLQNKTITFYEKISPFLLLAIDQAGSNAERLVCEEKNS